MHILNVPMCVYIVFSQHAAAAETHATMMRKTREEFAEREQRLEDEKRLFRLLPLFLSLSLSLSISISISPSLYLSLSLHLSIYPLSLTRTRTRISLTRMYCSTISVTFFFSTQFLLYQYFSLFGTPVQLGMPCQLVKRPWKPIMWNSRAPWPPHIGNWRRKLHSFVQLYLFVLFVCLCVCVVCLLACVFTCLLWCTIACLFASLLVLVWMFVFL